MNRTRTTRVALLALLSLGVVLGATPASAKDAKQELSRKVVVTGAALEVSDSIGTARDPAIGSLRRSSRAAGSTGRR